MKFQVIEFKDYMLCEDISSALSSIQQLNKDLSKIMDIKTVLKDAKVFLATKIPNQKSALDSFEQIKNKIIDDIELCKNRATQNIDKYNIHPLKHLIELLDSLELTIVRHYTNNTKF